MARLSRVALSPSCSFLCKRSRSEHGTRVDLQGCTWVVRFSEAEIVTVVEKTRMLVFTVHVAVVDPPERCGRWDGSDRRIAAGERDEGTTTGAGPFRVRCRWRMKSRR